MLNATYCNRTPAWNYFKNAFLHWQSFSNIYYFKGQHIEVDGYTGREDMNKKRVNTDIINMETA